MLKKLIFTFLLSLSILISPSVVSAQSCTRENECISNGVCKCQVWSGSTCVVWTNDDPCGSAIIGGVTMPQGVSDHTVVNGNLAQIGIINFASRLLVLLSIIAGGFSMFNFIKAGWIFLSAGTETKAAAEVRDLLTYSLIGVAVVGLSYTIAGLIGLVFFGDAGYILNPRLCNILDPASCS